MYGTGGRMVGVGVGAGGAGVVGSGVGPSELARTGAPLLLIAILGLILLVGGFVLVRTRLRSAGEGA